MTAVTLPADVAARARQRTNGSLAEGAGDVLLVAGRNLRKLTRTPQLIVFSTIQPVMFLLLFSYVFGGVAGSSVPFYHSFIVPTVMVQTLTFAASASGVKRKRATPVSSTTGKNTMQMESVPMKVGVAI